MMIPKPSTIKRHLEAIITGLKYIFVKNRLTLRYPEMVQLLSENYRGMIKYYMDRCISCTLCARICPADAIKMYTVGENKLPGINYMRCIFCGFCVDICPKEALEFTNIHDLAYYTREEQIQKPIEFSKGPPKPIFKKEPMKIVVKLDKSRGLKYERT
ncbi:MAG: NADH-quinone oxidoreductase subunit I [Nitrososphaerales archaeon]